MTEPSPSADYSNISIKSINCDPCTTLNVDSCGTSDGNSGDCVWVPSNIDNDGSCMNKCTARITKGECEQYHEWNRSRLTPIIYDYDGYDEYCVWHPHEYSVDDTVDSKEGTCRPKAEYVVHTTPTTGQGPGQGQGVGAAPTNHNSYCFETCTTGNNNDCTSSSGPGTCHTFKEGDYCIPNTLNGIGEVYCANLYTSHNSNNACYRHNGRPGYPFDEQGCNNDQACEVYQDPGLLNIPANTPLNDRGICVSDGVETYDLTTGQKLGLVKTDEECAQYTTSQDCISYIGEGCLWEPYNQYCVPKLQDGSIDTLLNSCKPMMGHVPGDYDVNMFDEEDKNIASYRDRDNKKYPYYTSKYLCDVCHIRDKDLDTMYDLNVKSSPDPSAADPSAAQAADKLKYFMIKKYVDFGIGPGSSDRGNTVPITAQDYCESNLNDNHDQFKACEWTADPTISKGGTCGSICSKHSPVDSTTTTPADLKIHKDQCVSDKWFPTDSGRDTEFPKLINNNETDDDYFEQRYCTWDGFECHNSIPCKFAQQTRCEDLGYEWYEGSAIDVMNQDSNTMGIPLDLSSSYPILRKGDGKPVEGDMEGICIYPNIDAGFISQPADYIVNAQYEGHQAVILKYREYGTGWWEDMSCMRKKNGLSQTDINDPSNTSNSYFLGENVLLIPFDIGQGEKCSDIKNKINAALQSYQYYVYNGEWLCWAEDIILAIDRSYDSTIDEKSMDGSNNPIDIYKKNYGYLYYIGQRGYPSTAPSVDLGDRDRRRLNVIYDMRGTVNLLPVVGGHAALEIRTFGIDTNTGGMSLTVETHGGIDTSLFQFAEFITPDIFSESADNLNSMLQLTVLSKYNYHKDAAWQDFLHVNLPENIVQGYGTLYESSNVENISDIVQNEIYDKGGYRLGVDNSNEYNILDGYKGVGDSSTSKHGETEIKNIIKMFYPIDSTDAIYEYTEEELETWAAYKEYKNFNIFSQPIIECGKEFKNKMDWQPSSTTKKKICGGSIESFKYFSYFKHKGNGRDNNIFPERIGNGIPTYQTLDLRKKNRMLRLFSRYFKEPTPAADFTANFTTNFIDYVINTLVDDTLGENLEDYRTIINHGEIKTAALWSISRNTPPFWGNLSFNRGTFGQTNFHPLYSLGCNFNNWGQIDEVGSQSLVTANAADSPINFRSQTADGQTLQAGTAVFKCKLSDTTLFKPFCEEEEHEEDQYIYWKRIMSYTGGNKREIQLSRNVSKSSYDQIYNLFMGGADDRWALVEDYSGNPQPAGVLGMSKDELLNKIKLMWPILSLSKREYILRSLMDAKRLPDSNASINNRSVTDPNIIGGSCPTYDTRLSDIYTSIKDYSIQDIVNNIAPPPTPTSSSILNQYISDVLGLDPTLENLVTERSYCGGEGDWDVSTITSWFSGTQTVGSETGAEDWVNDFDIYVGGAKPLQSDNGYLHTFQHNTDDQGTLYNATNCADYRRILNDPDTGASTANWNLQWDGVLDPDPSNVADLLTLCIYVMTDTDIQGDSNYCGWNGTGPNGEDIGTFSANYLYKQCCAVNNATHLDCRRETTSTDKHLYTNPYTPTSRAAHLFPILNSANDIIDQYGIVDQSNFLNKFQTGSSGSGSNQQPPTLLPINPTSVDSLIAGIYRLNNIAPTTSPVQDNIENASIWGHFDTGSPIDTTQLDEDAMWTILDTDAQTHLDHLKYPENMQIYTTSGTGSNPYFNANGANRPDDDKLRAWCMSTSDSLDQNFQLSDSWSHNPDNPEKQMGVLYTNWINGHVGDLLNHDDKSELFDNAPTYDDPNGARVNAYNHPMICEPWLLKSSTTENNLAHYTDSIVSWEYDNFNPLDNTYLTQAGSNYPDLTSIAASAGIMDDYDWNWSDGTINNPTHPTSGGDNYSINDTSNVFGYGQNQTITPTQFFTDGYNKTSNYTALMNSNKMYNMLYPYSITVARPKEKKIYVNITPNNDMFESMPADNPGINIYYFDKLLKNPETQSDTTYSTDLNLENAGGGTNNNTNPINRYDYPQTANDVSDIRYMYYWLHPGLNDMVSSNETVGISSNHKANLYVKYFKQLNLLTSSSVLNRGETDSTNYKFSFAPLPDYGASDLQNIRWYGSDGFNNQDVFYKKLPNNQVINNVPQVAVTVVDGTTEYTVSRVSTDTLHNQLFYPSDYETNFPEKGSDEPYITRLFFGTGFNTVSTPAGITMQGMPSTPTGGYQDQGEEMIYSLNDSTFHNYYNAGITIQSNPIRVREPLTSQIPFYNINMVFDSSDPTITSSQLRQCESIIKNKLQTCATPALWGGDTKSNCSTCFGSSDIQNQQMCSNYLEFIEGTESGLGEADGGVVGGMEPTADTTGIQIAKRAGVCGILNYNHHNETPWDFRDLTVPPQDFGAHMPAISPYRSGSDHRDCNNLQNQPTLNIGPDSGLDFVAIQHAGESGVGTTSVDHLTFWKPARLNSSDVFEDSNSGDDITQTPFGCMRKDLSLMDYDKLNVSCNTNLATPVERDKHVIINFIINHDPTSSLNTSQRTKLATMTEEELINKALSLGINIEDINLYTKPRLHTRKRDIYMPNLCEDGKTYCERDSDCTSSGNNYKCGLYEEWNDLQKYYYNITNPDDKSDFTSNREWDFVGCGIDLNYDDNSSGEIICKDKYPGLCEANVEKCTSTNDNVRNAIMLDCPETCQVQYKDLDTFKGQQIGELSICTSRGRCKWSHDQDPSNLLPPCEENTVRELGTVQKCRNFNAAQGGPATGSCNLELHPETRDSTVCKRQRCESMQGCIFTPQEDSYCRLESSVDTNITRETDCPQGGRWIGSSATVGQCIVPERDLTADDMSSTPNSFISDCNILGGTVISGTQESCEYQPDLPYSGEDPCNHVVDLDDLTTQEEAQYLFTPTSTIHVESIMPETLDGDSSGHPHYIKIILTHRLNTSTVTNYQNLTDMDRQQPFFPRDKYIYIDNNSDHIESVCSQYIVGKSKIVQINNVGDGSGEHTEIIIGGPNKSYILPRNPDNPSVIDIGDKNGVPACQFRGIYDLDQYYTNNTGTDSSLTAEQRKANACLNNPKGACTYQSGSEDCVSCSLYTDEDSCFGHDNPNEYSRCGWGSIEDMCGVIGEMDECKKMHLDGCEWDPAEEKCSLNKLTNTNGTPLINKVGCVKCDDIKHKNTCNSMKNCFWDGVSQSDTGIGACRACSSIGDPIGDGININGDAAWADHGKVKQDYESKGEACDDFKLTDGQCQFRNPVNHVTGFDVFSLDYILSQEEDFITAIKNSFLGLLGTPNTDVNDCAGNTNCKCSPTRLYPLFPDFIMHNLFFLFIMTPFIIYFIYAWYKVLIAPSVFTGKLGRLDTEGQFYLEDEMLGGAGAAGAEVAKLGTRYLSKDNEFGVVSDSLKGIASGAKMGASGIKSIGSAASGFADATVAAAKRIKEADFKGAAKDFAEKIKDIDINISNPLGPEINFVNSKGEFEKTTALWPWSANDDFGVIYKGFYSSVVKNKYFLQEIFSNLTIETDIDIDKAGNRSVNYGGTWCDPIRDLRNLKGKEYFKILLYLPFLFLRPKVFFKLIFVVLSFPFTIAQILANNIRGALPARISTFCFNISYKLLSLCGENIFKFPYGTIFGIIFGFISLILLAGSLALLPLGIIYGMKIGLDVLKRLLSYGILPNHNYVDPVEGVLIPPGTRSDKIIPKAAVYPRRIYREEWDDMIKDPIPDNVVQQREQLLPELIQGDVNDDDNVSDAYDLAYLTIEPESLNWSKYIRDAGKLYNKFINRIGDKFIYTWILLPMLTYSYVKMVNNLVKQYYETNSGFFDIKSFVIYTVIFALIIGILHALMTPTDPKDDEYDGVEAKCYGDIPTPFTLGNEVINYPKLCSGDSKDEDKYECPYGCYFIGDGHQNQPLPCKDNRSIFTLSGIFDPNPTLNIPHPTDPDSTHMNDWTINGPDGKHYTCPPVSRFISKQPYDSICATTAKRCKAKDATRHNSFTSDDYCEMLYRHNDYSDDACINNFGTGYDKYASGTKGPKGEIKDIDRNIECELKTPYDGYKEDYYCPFPLPAAENTFFSEEGNTRAPISLWQWTYDKIQHPEREETCTARCSTPGDCTYEEQNSIDICQAVELDEATFDENRTKCEGTPAGALACEYFPENIPLQMSIQNQERYLIVNQQYGENLFS